VTRSTLKILKVQIVEIVLPHIADVKSTSALQ